MRRNCILFLLGVVLGPVGFAQVQVSEEPMHHKVFDNGWVRILDVHVPREILHFGISIPRPPSFSSSANTKTGSQVKVEPGKRLLPTEDLVRRIL